uniref:Secreted protein n=1 Tax=Heterorhabditis bacteriophora TaxID=37862 RepID=A0A1I7XBI6_HETBA
MNLLFFLLGELQSSAALVPILGLFIIRSFLVPADAMCQDSDKDVCELMLFLFPAIFVFLIRIHLL